MLSETLLLQYSLLAFLFAMLILAMLSEISGNVMREGRPTLEPLTAAQMSGILLLDQQSHQQ